MAQTNTFGPASLPPVVEVVLAHRKTKEQRTYEQTELAIDGEARLLALVEQLGSVLTERNFPWDTLALLFDEQGQRQIGQAWPEVIRLLGIVFNAAPEAVIDSACIFLGVYATDEDGVRNPDYDETRKFLKGALSFTRWTDLVRTFLAQNDYARLARPFGEALTLTAGLQRATGNAPPSDRTAS